MKRPSADKPELLRWLQMQGDADRRILAQLWDLPSTLEPQDLARALAEPRRVEEQWQRLGAAEQAALARVLQEGGAIPVAILEREWGPVREPARFANPRAYLEALELPASPVERLYTMGLLVRATDERGPLYRVLNEFRQALPPPPPRDRTLRVTPVAEPPHVDPGAPESVDRTLLALLELANEGSLQTLDDGALNKASLVRLAKRISPGNELTGLRRESGWPWGAVFRVVALEAGLLTRGSDGVLHLGREAVAWLKLPRPERLAALFRAWRRAASLDELALFAALSWRSQPFALRLPESRATLVELLASLPPGEWLPVDSIAAEIERVEPDFLRRDGRYDRWLVYDERGQLLAGRESWGRIEGIFVRATLWRTLHWLGLVDLGGAEVLDTIRLTPLAAHVLQGAPAPVEPAPEPVSVQGTFEVICPPGASLYARFQLGRIAERVSDDAAAVFRLTRPSIVRAGESGIGVEEALRFLEEHGRAPVPQAVAAYMREWAGHVGRLRLEEAALLRADDPLRLVELRQVRGVTLPPVEELTPTAWKLAPGDVGSLVQQLDKAGFGVEGGAATRGATGKPSARPISDHDLRALVTAAYAYATACADLGLPCEVSHAMLMRLAKLVPSRQLDAAYRAAQTLRASIGERHASAGNTGEGEQDA